MLREIRYDWDCGNLGGVCLPWKGKHCLPSADLGQAGRGSILPTDQFFKEDCVNPSFCVKSSGFQM